jgi:nucleotide-binding universal stress UspA family protein
MTMMPVVVGVDGSAPSLRAVEWAAGAARRYGAPLRIVAAPATPPRIHGQPGAAEAIAKILRDISARPLGEALIRVGEVAPGLSVDTSLLSGPPAVAVTASGAGALMLVVGARGVGGFAGLLLGSVSRYTATHASCPVVVVRAETDAVHRVVVVGAGGGHESDATLGFAFDEAARRGATLVVVHSWFWLTSVLGEPGRVKDLPGSIGDPGRIPAGIGEHLEAELAGWRAKYPQVTVRQDIVHGHPARTLADYSARADLVVIGRHPAAHATGAVAGIQHAVLSHAQGPIAVIPSEG